MDRIACTTSASFVREGSYLILAVLEAKLTWADSNPWHRRKRLLDRGWAVGAGHASDAQINVFGGRLSGGGVNWLGIHGKWAHC